MDRGRGSECWAVWIGRGIGGLVTLKKTVVDVEVEDVPNGLELDPRSLDRWPCLSVIILWKGLRSWMIDAKKLLTVYGL
jgi:hypothetical protein